MIIDSLIELVHCAHTLPNPKVARFLSVQEYTKHRTAIEAALRERMRSWGAHGFRVVGQPPKLRIEVLVTRTIQKPRCQIEAFSVGKLWIKPKVSSSGVLMRREQRADGSSCTAIGGAHALAPGARVRVGRGATQEFVGVAAVLSLPDGPALLTCGHAGAFTFCPDVLASDEPNGDAIATLHTNLLEAPTPLDAAICPLTDAGMDLLNRSLDAPTWRFQRARRPSAADHLKSSVFWETHDGADDAPTAPIVSYNSTNTALFGAAGPSGGFIETRHDVFRGDSGSLLSLGDELYGICAGYVGYTALFTPIATVLDRLRKEGTKCSVYHPRAR